MRLLLGTRHQSAGRTVTCVFRMADVSLNVDDGPGLVVGVNLLNDLTALDGISAASHDELKATTLDHDRVVTGGPY